MRRTDHEQPHKKWLEPFSIILAALIVATALFISPSTAGVHVSNILSKLGVSSRTEAASVAVRDGLVSVDV